ncbi:MAG TPA: hypothetical protein VF516_45225 [Kofleriaceae bacterium]
MTVRPPWYEPSRIAQADRLPHQVRVGPGEIAAAYAMGTADGFEPLSAAIERMRRRVGELVCGGPIAEPHFANAWERVRKLYPCCSPPCAARFDPDIQWLPAERPPPATPDDEQRLVRTGAERLRAGDRPSLVVRDLLLAGIAPRAVRKLLTDAELSVAANDRWVDRLNVLGVISLLFGGRWRVAERNDRRDLEQLRTAATDLETWSARFG